MGDTNLQSSRRSVAPSASGVASGERRTLCLLCAGRCDPDKYTCRECARRLWTELSMELTDEAYSSK